MDTNKELEEYRKAIVYMTIQLGMGRIAFANKDLETARKHFQNAFDAGSGALPVVAKLGQTRRFRAAARTSLGDVALRQGRYKDAAKTFSAGKRRRKDARAGVERVSRRAQDDRNNSRGQFARRRIAHDFFGDHGRRLR